MKTRTQLYVRYAFRGMVAGTAAGLVIVLAIGRYRAARCQRQPGPCPVCEPGRLS